MRSSRINHGPGFSGSSDHRPLRAIAANDLTTRVDVVIVTIVVVVGWVKVKNIRNTGTHQNDSSLKMFIYICYDFV